MKKEPRWIVKARASANEYDRRAGPCWPSAIFTQNKIETNFNLIQTHIKVVPRILDYTTNKEVSGRVWMNPMEIQICVHKCHEDAFVEGLIWAWSSILPDERPLFAFLHELVHIQQWNQGLRWDQRQLNNLSDYEYSRLPHEREANTIANKVVHIIRGVIQPTLYP